jgi:hypothetical protein
MWLKPFWVVLVVINEVFLNIEQGFVFVISRLD